MLRVYSTQSAPDSYRDQSSVYSNQSSVFSLQSSALSLQLAPDSYWVQSVAHLRNFVACQLCKIVFKQAAPIET